MAGQFGTARATYRWHTAAVFEFAQLAGFFAAHGIWSVSDGATLIPMLGFERGNGERGMSRFVLDDLGAAAQAGREALAANPEGVARAALVVDGYVHLEAGKVDALIVEAVEYGPQHLSLTIAVPYRPPARPGGFAVHRPKFLSMTGVDRQQAGGLAEAFFAGVDGHEQAATVWNAHLDDSL
jgi:hypothetical protein